MAKKWIVIGSIFGVIAIGSVIFAGCAKHCCTPEKKAEWVVKKITKKLDLNDAQVVKVNRIKDEILAKKDDVKKLREGMKSTIIAQVKSDKFDTAAVNALFEKKEKDIKGLRAFLVNKAAEFHSILTPEQRQKLVEQIEKHHKRHKRWHH